jgi:hypothetical protein
VPDATDGLRIVWGRTPGVRVLGVVGLLVTAVDRWFAGPLTALQALDDDPVLLCDCPSPDSACHC